MCLITHHLLQGTFCSPQRGKTLRTRWRSCGLSSKSDVSSKACVRPQNIFLHINSNAKNAFKLWYHFRFFCPVKWGFKLKNGHKISLVPWTLPIPRGEEMLGPPWTNTSEAETSPDGLGVKRHQAVPPSAAGYRWNSFFVCSKRTGIINNQHLVN